MKDEQPIKSEYWSKSDAFLVPLTGIKKGNFIIK